MTSLKKWTPFLIGVVCISCEKVIEPDLNDAEPYLIIEGEITNQIPSCKVHISYSTPFSEANVFKGVQGASVTITDDQGNSELLTEAAPGIYTSNTLVGIPGRTYQLNATVEGNNYTASSAMPQPIALDALSQKMQLANGNVRRFVIPFYQDPGTETNYYRFKVFSNDKPLDKILVRNDKLNNGLVVSDPLGPFFLELVPGDTANVQMMCIDKAVYDHFFSLEQTLNSNGSAPSNPISNITGGCLGYFSAHTVSVKSIVIVE